MSSSGLNLENFRIPLEEINRATQNFSSETLIGDEVYRGKLSECWQNRNAVIKRHFPNSILGKEEFLNERELMSNFHHENIIPFIGYCDEGDEMIIVTEYAVNGSLEHHLGYPNKRRSLTWARRLKICSGVAKGLEYLQTGLGERGRVILREPKSRRILLDENMDAKICEFEFSIIIPINQPYVYARPVGTRYYIDPVYQESSQVNAKTDMYGFGVVVFEMLIGMLAYESKSSEDGNPLHLMEWVRRHYDVGFEKIIDPDIRDQMDRISLNMVKEIAYKCISLNIKDRPTLDVIIKTIDRALDIHERLSMNKITRRIEALKDFQIRTITIQSHQNQNLEDFLIPLEEIKMAIGGDFSMETQAGDGGFGVVYKGQLSERWKNRTVAIKRLRDDGGNTEFLNELKLIFRFQHENIIPFIGYCAEGSEMIIVTEYASNGSLDCYLEDEEKRGGLTWTQRLKICLGAARGLNHVHSGLGKGNKVIHRDIKSANILLNDNLEAKICDFGLSKLDLTNQSHTGVYTKDAGTRFYIDPIYHESGKLRTKSDVYSFGVVMFEMLSGMMAHHYKKFGDGKPQNLISLVRRYYEMGGVEMLMDPLIRDQRYDIDARSFQIFQDTAYECINMNHKERPTVDTIVDRIEEALSYQASLPPPF